MQRFTIAGLSVLLVSGLMVPVAQADTSTAPQSQPMQSQPIQLQSQPADSSEKQPTVNPVRIEAVKSVDAFKKVAVPTLSERDRLIQEYRTQRVIPSQE